MAFLFAGFIFYRYTFVDNPKPTQSTSEKSPIVVKKAFKKSFKRFMKKERPNTNKISPNYLQVKLTVAKAVIKDITGEVINSISLPVLAGGWVALPQKVCLGGAKWVLKLSSEEDLNIIDGIYRDYDAIGLWRIDESHTIGGPTIYPWSPDEPLFWQSLNSQSLPLPIVVNAPREYGYFIEGKFPNDPNEMGVLLQNRRIVGWTFGSPLPGAYLWNGDKGNSLQAETRVEDFYRITFADGREEKFTLALAKNQDLSNIERLWAMANGFLYPPKLSLEDTPNRVKPSSIINNMLLLITKAKQSGYEREVADIFDTQILVEANDARLLIAAAETAANGLGFSQAIELAESVVDELGPVSPGETSLIENFFSVTYQGWLSGLLQNDDLPDAYQVYQQGRHRLPDDLNLHLLGVELALAGDNWADAEELLFMKEYPLSLNDKVENLQAKISELKAREGKVVIRFQPGSRHIRVTTVVNQNTPQPFVIDTGASFVSIPTAAAKELGITVDSRHKKYEVATASGVVYAPVVTLESITIEGRQFQNVKAFVMDLPNQSEMGLLGMNFLSRFRMDMDTVKGVLLLEPR